MSTEVRFHQQIRQWLGKMDKDWTIGETEQCAHNVRQMLMTLAARRRANTKPPIRFPQLACLMDKMHMSDSDREEDLVELKEVASMTPVVEPQEVAVMTPVVEPPKEVITVTSEEEASVESNNGPTKR